MKNLFTHKMRGKSPGVIAGWVILGVLGISALAILFGFVIMWLWNWLMPELFGLPALTYWQAVGIFILGRIIFGSSGSGSSSNCKNDKSSKYSDADCKTESKGSFSKWKLYDKFWKEEGEQSYNAYVERKDNPQSDETTE